MTQSTDQTDTAADRPLDQLVTSHTAVGDAVATTTTRGVGIVEYKKPLADVEIEVREPQAGEVQIALVSAGVGLWDVEEVAGIAPLPLPKAVGWQGAGTIEKVGEDVDAFAVGDAVIAYAPMAGFVAERVTVPAALVTPAPTKVPLADAGALLIGASTAYQALVDVGRLTSGQKVLITAAAGGTGGFAVELAKHLGGYVIATAGPDNHDFLREVGADEIHDYNQDAIAAIRERHPDGVDLLVDNVSANNYTEYANLVRQGGMALSTHEPMPAAPDGIEGQLVASWERPASFAEVVKLVDDGVLNLRIRRRFALSEAEQALEHLRGKRGRGAVLIEL